MASSYIEKLIELSSNRPVPFGANYDCKDAGHTYHSFPDFLTEFGDNWFDLNPIVLWSMFEGDEGDDSARNNITLRLIVVWTRKGRYVPITVENITEADEQAIKEFLSKCAHYMKGIWAPVD